MLGARATVEIRCNRPADALAVLDRAVQHDPIRSGEPIPAHAASSPGSERKAEAEAERKVMDQIRAEQDRVRGDPPWPGAESA